MKAKMSDKENALYNMVITGNGGESKVESARPNPDEGVYSVVPDDWSINESVGVINATFKIGEKLGTKDAPEVGRLIRIAFWTNNPKAVLRTARGLHLALTGKFLNDQPQLTTVIDWFNQLMSADEWIVRRTVREADNGRLFENDAFYSKQRWHQLEADRSVKTSVEAVAAAIGDA